MRHGGSLINNIYPSVSRERRGWKKMRLGLFLFLWWRKFLPFFKKSEKKKKWRNIENKTGVIHDPLGQPTVPAGRDCHLILSFGTDGLTAGRTNGHSVWKLWSLPASWIKREKCQMKKRRNSSIRAEPILCYFFQEEFFPIPFSIVINLLRENF